MQSLLESTNQAAPEMSQQDEEEKKSGAQALGKKEKTKEKKAEEGNKIEGSAGHY